MNKNQLQKSLEYLETAAANIAAAKQILNNLNPERAEEMQKEKKQDAVPMIHESTMTPQGKVIEGVFDGQNMIGPDGKQYSVPANYASKSKLVEGDVMKLTIATDGSFIYKQIGPIERERLIGTLMQDQETDRYYVTANGHNYKILLASVTYFKGEVGDEAIILKPKVSESEWAAVENIIKPLLESSPSAQITPTQQENSPQKDQTENPVRDKTESESQTPEEEKLEDI